ncbi:MAG: response regulator [Candidatus Omnitrophota bacterium]
MKKISILSIDDEASFLGMIKQYFEPRGYEIDIASEGAEGLELIRKKTYDVALLDLKMGGMNGDEIMRSIKRAAPATRVIFITAFSDSGKTQKRLTDEGAYAFVEKPVTSLKALEELVMKAAADKEQEEVC